MDCTLTSARTVGSDEDVAGKYPEAMAEASRCAPPVAQMARAIRKTASRAAREAPWPRRTTMECNVTGVYAEPVNGELFLSL